MFTLALDKVMLNFFPSVYIYTGSLYMNNMPGSANFVILIETNQHKTKNYKKQQLLDVF